MPTVTTEITAMSVVDTPPAVPGRHVRRGRQPSRPPASIFRVNADGTWDELWESREDAPYDLVVEDDGDLLVATGHKGKLYRLSGDPLRASLVGTGPRPAGACSCCAPAAARSSPPPTPAR